MALMTTDQPQGTGEYVTYDHVKVGDTLMFLTRDNGFTGGGGPVDRSGVVISKTDKTVVVRTSRSNLARSSRNPTARLRRADWSSRAVRRTGRIERLPYDAEHTVTIDDGDAVTVIWTPNPNDATDPNILDRLLDRSLEIEVIATMRKVRESEGAFYTGWFITQGSSNNPTEGGTRKRDALLQLREVVADFFARNTIVKTVPARDGLLGYQVHAIRKGAPLPGGRHITSVEDYGSDTHLIVVDSSGSEHYLHRHTEIRQFDNGRVSLMIPEQSGWAE